MKKQILRLFTVTLSAAVILTACKKEGSNNNISETEISQHSDDQSRFETETDAVVNDVNIALESYGSFTGRVSNPQTLICNATVTVDSVSNPRTITIAYNGASCLGNTTRTGNVIISMEQGIQWKDAGAAITVACQDLHVTRLSDNKSININGSMTYTNESGGLLINLPIASVTHSINSSPITVTFDDNTQRNWMVAKQRVFSYNNGIVVTTTGTHTEGNETNIAEWGTNRFGRTFTSAISEPLIVKQDCSFRLASGQVTHKTENITAVATFGLDANGAPTACPGAGNYYFKVVFSGANGNSVTVIWPY